MSDMITVASGFQYSVNIGYDLSNNSKLKNFIPTKSALNLLEDILAQYSSFIYRESKGFNWCLWQG